MAEPDCNVLLGATLDMAMYSNTPVTLGYTLLHKPCAVLCCALLCCALVLVLASVVMCL